LRSCHVPWGEPQRTCRAVSRLTALHALRSIPLTLPPIRRSRAPLISWWAPISASPRRGAPRSVALSSTGGECASTSDTPCHDRLRAFRRAAGRQGRLPRSPVKGCSSNDPRCLPSTSARSAPRPFRDAGPRTRARHRCPGLAARDPASDALSPPRSGEGVARPRPLPCALHARALLATRRSSTSAIETIHKHDLRTSKPSSLGGRTAFAELLAHRAGPHFDGAAAGCPTSIPSKRSRGFTGQGPFGCATFFRGSRRPPPPRWLAAEASPQPDRLEHLMSRHPGRLR